MAKNSSLFKVEGTLDEVTFYKRNGSHFVKTKSGVSKDRIMNEAGFVRTRENMSEFASAAQAGKLMRHSLGYLIKRVRDSRMTGRMTGVMARVKQHDTVSDRGLRQVSIGLSTDEGKILLKGFDFNLNAPLSLVMQRPYNLDVTTGKIVVEQLNPTKHMRFTDGATHASFSSSVLVLDFDTKEFNLKTSEEQLIPIQNESFDISVTPESIPQGTGTLFYLLMIEFVQEFNGKMYPLNNGDFNMLHLLTLN